MSRDTSTARETDGDVIASSLQEPAAFARIFDRHHEAMWRFVWSRVGDEAAADDLAAEVFRIAFEQRQRFDLEYDSAKPWLFGIAANLVREHHRTRTKRDETRERLRSEPGPDTVSSPQHRLEQLPSTPMVDALLDLPERDRAPLLLYAWDELSYEEIAAALDVPIGTVRSRIHRARTSVRDQLDPSEVETGHPSQEPR